MDALIAGHGEFDAATQFTFKMGVQEVFVDRLVFGVTLFQTLMQRGVIGLPDNRAGIDIRQVDVAGAEFEFECILPRCAKGARPDRENAPALLILFRMTFIEDYAITGFTEQRANFV